jgi:hypothetical protein
MFTESLPSDGRLIRWVAAFISEVSSNLSHYVKKASKISESSVNEQMYWLFIVFFKNQGSTVIFLYLFLSALVISLHFLFYILGLPFVSLIRIIA